MGELSALQLMDRDFFGFGNWSAPYWFIGPEQGKGRFEDDSSGARLAAWERLHRPEVCDCARFHQHLGDTTWHQPVPPHAFPPLQSTWRSLMLFLLEYREEPSTVITRKRYQASHWGAKDGDTCVIELSGIAARRLRAESERHEFLAHRVERIRSGIASYRPELVLMYGLADRPTWKAIAGQELQADSVALIRGTIFVMSPHPLDFGRTNAAWKRLAARARVCRLPSVP